MTIVVLNELLINDRREFKQKTMSKEYSNGELTIVWKPDLCIHAGECVKLLPKVYKPKERPWIQVENGETEALIKQINACPSGALSYYLNEKKMEELKQEETQMEITIKENGPFLVKGKIAIKHIDGKTEFRDKTTALCRCGVSENKPFCDGKHSNIHFRG